VASRPIYILLMMCSEYVSNVRRAEIWRAARYTTSWTGMTVKAITDRDVKLANTSPEKGKTSAKCKSGGKPSANLSDTPVNPTSAS